MRTFQLIKNQGATMQTHRVWIAATFVWLFALFNIERFYEPVSIALFVCALATLGGVLMLCVRPLRETTLARSIAAALIVCLVIRFALGYSVSFNNLPITLADAAAIAGTMFLARRIGLSSDALAGSISQSSQTTPDLSVPALVDVESDIRREMLPRGNGHVMAASSLQVDAGICGCSDDELTSSAPVDTAPQSVDEFNGSLKTGRCACCSTAAM